MKTETVGSGVCGLPKRFKGLVFRDKELVPGARTALAWAVAGLFFCGFVLGSIAIAKAGHSIEEATLNPGRYAGAPTAETALLLGAVDVVVWTIVAVLGVAIV